MSGSAGSQKQTGTQSNQFSSTTNPILSDEWKNAFNGYGANLNAGGANANQQAGLDWMRNNLANDPVGAATAQTNAVLGQSLRDYGTLNMTRVGPLGDQLAHQLGAAPSATATVCVVRSFETDAGVI